MVRENPLGNKEIEFLLLQKRKKERKERKRKKKYTLTLVH